MCVCTRYPSLSLSNENNATHSHRCTWASQLGINNRLALMLGARQWMGRESLDSETALWPISFLRNKRSSHSRLQVLCSSRLPICTRLRSPTMPHRRLPGWTSAHTQLCRERLPGNMAGIESGREQRKSGKHSDNDDNPMVVLALPMLASTRLMMQPMQPKPCQHRRVVACLLVDPCLRLTCADHDDGALRTVYQGDVRVMG